MKLKPINDPDRFEFFDFELNDGIYVDFKNWKPTYLQDRESTTERIRQKLDTIKGKKDIYNQPCRKQQYETYYKLMNGKL